MPDAPAHRWRPAGEPYQRCTRCGVERWRGRPPLYLVKRKGGEVRTSEKPPCRPRRRRRKKRPLPSE